MNVAEVNRKVLTTGAFLLQKQGVICLDKIDKINAIKLCKISTARWGKQNSRKLCDFILNHFHFHSLLVMSLSLSPCVYVYVPAIDFFFCEFQTCEFQQRKTNNIIWFPIIMWGWLSCVFTRYIHRKMCVHEKRMLNLFVIEAWGSACACSCVGYFSVWTFRNRPSPTHSFLKYHKQRVISRWCSPFLFQWNSLNVKICNRVLFEHSYHFTMIVFRYVCPSYSPYTSVCSSWIIPF